MSDGSERRRHSRKKVELPAEFQLGQGPRIASVVEEMSVGGCFLRTDEVRPFGTPLTIFLKLSAGESETALPATVRWMGPRGMGVQYAALRARQTYDLLAFLSGRPVKEAQPVAPRKSKRRPLLHPVSAKPTEAATASESDEPKPAMAEPTAADVSALEAQLTQKDVKLRERDDELKALRRVLEQRHEQLRELQKQVDQLTAAADGAREHASQQDEAAQQVQAQLQQRSEQLQAQIEQRDQRLLALQQEVGQLEEQLWQPDDNLARLQEQLRQRDATVAELRAELARSASPPAARRDDLTRIKGIGKVFARALQDAGVHRIKDIAAWSEEDIAKVAGALKISPLRIERGGWVQSAASLLEDGEPDGSP